jgi:glucose/arabinose dehydrogenase
MQSRNAMNGVIAVCAAALVAASVTAAIQAQAPAAPQGQGPAPAPQQQGGGGRRGGGPPPGTTLFNEQCAGCHGDGTTTGRAPNLFEDAFLARMDDAAITATVKAGRPGTEMPAFAALTDLQVFQLIQHIRTTTATVRPAPVFVANPNGTVIRSQKQAFRVELVADGLATPWALAALPDGRLLVTERDGRLRVIDKGTLSEPVAGAPQPHVQQDGGYLDIEVHPQFARNGWIYLAYVESQPGYVAPPPAPAPATPDPAVAGRGGRGGPPQPPSMTVIVRGRINNRNQWTDQQVIYRAPADLYTTSGAHYGCRMIFDAQNHLFFSIGERNVQPNAQNLGSPLGKIHRVNDDGTVPRDNPFVATAGAVPSIWTYGHRNPEGLAWDPVTGVLWASEHGPNSADEINIIEKGHNYGWAVASKAAQPGVELSMPGMDDPIVYFTPTYAPAGIAFYTGNRYPQWKNSSLFVSGLRGQALRRLEISGRSVRTQEVLFNQFGRVRDLVQAPDGLFYVALQDPTGVPNPAGGNIPLSASTPGRVVRLVPVP